MFSKENGDNLGDFSGEVEMVKIPTEIKIADMEEICLKSSNTFLALIIRGKFMPNIFITNKLVFTLKSLHRFSTEVFLAMPEFSLFALLHE